MSNTAETAAVTPKEDMELINALARRELSPGEVYTFPVVLCDNETDRDGERFSVEALEKLAELFVGKTGIFDHDAKGRSQTARIYSAEVSRGSGRVTRSGEEYACVKAKAYMMRTASNADLISEIEGGIKKEVSVSCSVARKLCGICGADMRVSPCRHEKGAWYGGKLCDIVLDGVTDAYEWSFVAVPAQPGAGITKSLGGSTGADFGAERKALMEQIELSGAENSELKREMTAEIIRLGQFCVPAYDPDTVKSLCSAMNAQELIGFKEKTRSLAKTERLTSVLEEHIPDDEDAERGNSLFRLAKNKKHSKGE